MEGSIQLAARWGSKAVRCKRVVAHHIPLSMPAAHLSLSLSLSLSPPPPKQKAITLICVRHAASHSRMRWCQQENEKTLSLEARSLCVQLLWVSGTAGATGGNTLGRAHTIRKELNGQSIWKSVSNLWRHA